MSQVIVQVTDVTDLLNVTQGVTDDAMVRVHDSILESALNAGPWGWLTARLRRVCLATMESVSMATIRVSGCFPWPTLSAYFFPPGVVLPVERLVVSSCAVCVTGPPSFTLQRVYQ